MRTSTVCADMDYFTVAGESGVLAIGAPMRAHHQVRGGYQASHAHGVYKVCSACLQGSYLLIAGKERAEPFHLRLQDGYFLLLQFILLLHTMELFMQLLLRLETR